MNSAENSLLQFVSQKVTCLADCTDQEAKLRVRNRLLLCKAEALGTHILSYVKKRAKFDIQEKLDPDFFSYFVVPFFQFLG